MENVIHRLTLDLTGPDMCPMIEVQRGDSARSLIISLTQGGRPYWIDEGLTAALYGKKPDGNPLFNACTIEKNRIRYDFTPQTANVFGTFDCEIWLVAGDKRELTTPRFTIAVDERMRTDDVIPESAPEYTAITEMVAAGTAMLEDLREALEGLEGVEEILTQARVAAEAASGSEKAAAESARNANAAAEVAEAARDGAAQERAAAETAAADALGYAEDAELQAKAAEGSERNSRSNLQAAEVAAQTAQTAAAAAAAAEETIRNHAVAAARAAEEARLANVDIDQKVSRAETAEGSARSSAETASTAASSARTHAEQAAQSAQEAKDAADRAGAAGGGGGYIASDEPPEDTRALWIDTSKPGEAVALGVTAVETEEGVEVYATDELGTTKATVRHGKDGAQGPQGAPGEDYVLTDEDMQEIAGIAAGMVPGGGGDTKSWRKIAEHTVAEDSDSLTWFEITQDKDGNPLDLKKIMLICTPLFANSTDSIYILANSQAGRQANYIESSTKAYNNNEIISIVERVHERVIVSNTTVQSLNTAAIANVRIRNSEYPIDGIRLGLSTVRAGTKYEVWGIDK